MALDIDERFYLPRRDGGGMIRREIWVDDSGRIAKYNLAHISHLIYRGDHGRVLGFDSAHGQHHRHFKGEVTSVAFESFEKVDARFEREWTQLVKEVKRAEN